MGLWYALRPGCRLAGLAIAGIGAAVSRGRDRRDRPALRARWRLSVRGTVRGTSGARRAGSWRRRSATRARSSPPSQRAATEASSSTSSRPLALLPLLVTGSVAGCRARDRARPALLDEDADVDPLPLHGGRDPRADGRGDPRSGPSAAPGAPRIGRSRPCRRRGRGRRPGCCSARFPSWRFVPGGAELGARRARRRPPRRRIREDRRPRAVRAPWSARRTRSGHTSRRDVASSASQSAATRRGSWWTRADPATSTGPTRRSRSSRRSRH